MNTRTIFLIVFFLPTAGAVGAQDVDMPPPEVVTVEAKVVKRNPTPPVEKEHVRFGLKFSYNASLPEIGHLAGSADVRPTSVDLIRRTTVGPALRIPLGRVFYLQGEALFGIHANWAETEKRSGLWNRLEYSIKYRTTSYMWVPVYAGVRWAPASYFALRGFVGPRFDFDIDYGNYTFVKDHYTLTAGAGLDLLKAFSIELGYHVDMNRFSVVEGSGLWFLAASLMF